MALDRYLLQEGYIEYVASADRDHRTINNCSRDLVTHRELVMMRVMNKIIEKPDWNTKVCFEMSTKISQG